MFRPYPSEEFREVSLDPIQSFRYALSSRGRIIRFRNDMMQDGDEYKSTLVSGYQTITYRVDVNGKFVRKTIYVYKLFAEYFIRKTSEDQIHVLHLDYDRANDDLSNLKWATNEERLEHHRKSPHMIKARQMRRETDYKTNSKKLTATQVIRLKKLIHDPNRKTRMKILAKQFGISEMQLYRIKSGENWGHVKV